MDTSDPRVGSARDNSTAPGLSRLVAGSNSSSGRNLLATLVPVLLWSTICLIIFFVLRRKSPRVYSPRALLKSLEPQYVNVPGLRIETDQPRVAKGVRRYRRAGSTGAGTFIAFLQPLSSTIHHSMPISFYGFFAF
jgi:hypothetical protein